MRVRQHPEAKSGTGETFGEAPVPLWKSINGQGNPPMTAGNMPASGKEFNAPQGIGAAGLPTKLIPFEFEGRAVRVVSGPDYEPWFVLADVCQVLDLAEPHRVASRLDDDERGRHSVTTPGGQQDMTVINESGLYSLVLTSRKPAAKRFKKWVTADVLPTIRKTGSYGVDRRDPLELLNDPSAMRGLLLTYSEKVLALQSEVSDLSPKASALDRIASADGSLCITDAAKALQIPPKSLFSYLQANGWIYRRPGGGHYLGYQTKVNAGLLEHKVETISRPDGSEKMTEQVRITPKGLTKLSAQLNPIAAE